MAPPIVPSRYSAVACREPPTLICVTITAVSTAHNPLSGMFQICASANASIRAKPRAGPGPGGADRHSTLPIWRRGGYLSPRGEGRLVSLSALDEAQALVERAKHAGEVMTALEYQPGGRNDAIGALAAGEFRRLLDAVKRNFGRAPEHGEHRLLAQDIDGVIAPLTARHFAAVDIQDL